MSHNSKLEYRCRLDKEAPIGYYTNRFKVKTRTICHKEFVIDPYDERYKKSISLAEQLRSKHYKNVGSGHVAGTPYVRGYDYIIFEKTFMFYKIYIIDPVGKSTAIYYLQYLLRNALPLLNKQGHITLKPQVEL